MEEREREREDDGRGLYIEYSTGLLRRGREREMMVVVYSYIDNSAGLLGEGEGGG